MVRYRIRTGEPVELPSPLAPGLGRVITGAPSARAAAVRMPVGVSGQEISINLPVEGQWLTVIIDPENLNIAVAGNIRNGERKAAIDAAKALLFDVAERLYLRSLP